MPASFKVCPGCVQLYPRMTLRSRERWLATARDTITTRPRAPPTRPTRLTTVSYTPIATTADSPKLCPPPSPRDHRGIRSQWCGPSALQAVGNWPNAIVYRGRDKHGPEQRNVAKGLVSPHGCGRRKRSRARFCESTGAATRRRQAIRAVGVVAVMAWLRVCLGKGQSPRTLRWNPDEFSAVGESYL